MNRISTLFSIAFILLVVASPSAAVFPNPPGGAYDFTAVGSGTWHDPCVWHAAPCSGKPLPGASSRVLISSPFSVTIQRVEPVHHRFVRVEGTLRMWIHSDTKLVTETLYIAAGGAFTIGLANHPVKAHARAELVITGGSDIDLGWDPKQASRGLISDGRVHAFGIRKKHVVTLAGEALAGSTSLTLSGPTIDLADVGNAKHVPWRRGDEVVVAGTYYQRVLGLNKTSSQDDRRTIASVSGSQVNLIGGLTHDHQRAVSSDNSQKIHLVNLTRNVVFRSESPGSPRDRGHVMFRNGDVDIRHAAFIGLGRTDKRKPLDDIKVDRIPPNPPFVDYNITVPANSMIKNPRGRYSVHFHRNLDLTAPLPTTASLVSDSVVDDAIGWGFVNHSSYVDFHRNVAYNFAGAGFVTELGDEVGSLIGNVAIRGHGNSEFRPVRIVFANAQRKQPLSDFGFSGDGFWFQGPAIRARDNVASGCDGAGMIWFTTGAPDIDLRFVEGGRLHNRYTHFPRAWVPAVYGGFTGLLPRYWDHSTTDEKLVLSDLPIVEMDGFEGYGNLVGFRLRFNNQWNLDWYKEDPYDYDEHIVVVCGNSNQCAKRRRQTISNVRLWNNEMGLRVRYNTVTDWNHVKVVNRLAYSDPRTHNPDRYVGHAGAEINFQMQGATFADVTIDGYPVAGWIENKNNAVRNLTCFHPQCPTTNWSSNYANYSNFVNKDTWNRSLDTSCGTPTAPWHDQVTSTSARLRWTAAQNNGRYLARYRVLGEQRWTSVLTTGASKIVGGLSAGRTYEFQVLAGCSIGGSDGLSKWSTTDAFTTP